MKSLRVALAMLLISSLAACSNSDTTPPREDISSGTHQALVIPKATPIPTPTEVVTPANAKPPTCKYRISRGPNCSSRVVLSFDDCPRSYKAFKARVRAAEKLDLAIVFFPIGNCIKIKRFNVAYALNHGHYVFNHSVTHPLLTQLSYKAVLKELRSPGVVTNYGRPPFGAYDATVRKAYTYKHMRIWNWGVDTLDWKGKSRASVVKHVVKYARAGDTVLMHMQWNGFDATALRQIKDGLVKRGLKVCRNYPGTTPAVLSGNLRC